MGHQLASLNSMSQLIIKKPSKTVPVCENSAGQRIDNFLFSRLKDVPKSQVYKFIRTGQVRVNKSRVKSQYKLNLGDCVRIPPYTTSNQDSNKPKGRLKEDLSQRILFENSDLLIINKPSGLAVHGGSGIKLGLIEGLRQIREQGAFLELAHRLDRDTSGIIIVAKSRKALVELHRQLREGEITKTYLALVDGQWNSPKKVSLPLKKNFLASGERIVRVDPEGKEALTLFKAIKTWNTATLVEAKPVTGRTHQIRVHAAYMGHPIWGDDKYSTKASKAAMIDPKMRLFLHASSIAIPYKDGVIKVQCEIDDRLKDLLSKLDKQQ